MWSQTTVNMCVCVHIYIYIHTHTYIHENSSQTPLIYLIWAIFMKFNFIINKTKSNILTTGSIMDIRILFIEINFIHLQNKHA